MIEFFFTRRCCSIYHEADFPIDFHIETPKLEHFTLLGNEYFATPEVCMVLNT